PSVADDDGGVKDVGSCGDLAVRIADPADAGVGGAYEIPAFLDRTHRRLFEVLIRRRRGPEPRIVRDRRQQLAALGDEPAHEIRIDDLVANGGTDLMRAEWKQRQRIARVEPASDCPHERS